MVTTSHCISNHEGLASPPPRPPPFQNVILWMSQSNWCVTMECLAKHYGVFRLIKVKLQHLSCSQPNPSFTAKVLCGSDRKINTVIIFVRDLSSIDMFKTDDVWTNEQLNRGWRKLRRYCGSLSPPCGDLRFWPGAEQQVSVHLRSSLQRLLDAQSWCWVGTEWVTPTARQKSWRSSPSYFVLILASWT